MLFLSFQTVCEEPINLKMPKSLPGMLITTFLDDEKSVYQRKSCQLGLFPRGVDVPAGLTFLALRTYLRNSKMLFRLQGKTVVQGTWIDVRKDTLDIVTILIPCSSDFFYQCMDQLSKSPHYPRVNFFNPCSCFRSCKADLTLEITIFFPWKILTVLHKNRI